MGGICMYKLLVVDDEPYVRQGLRLLIHEGNSNFEVFGEAGNAFEALELLHKESYDAAMIDIKMPKMGGLTLIHRLRAEGFPNLPVIILSGYFDYTNAKAAMDCDVVTYLLKPIQPNHLEEALDKVEEQIRQQKLDRIYRNNHELNSVMLYINQMLSASYNLASEQCLGRYFKNAKGYYYLRLEWDRKPENDFDKKILKQRAFCQRYLYKALPVQTPGRARNELTEYGFVITDLTLINSNTTLEEYIISLLQELVKAGFEKIKICHGQYVDSVTRLSESYRTAIEPLSSTRDCSGTELLMQIEEYIKMHFRETISISSISKHFYINAAYLGQIYKKQYGVYIKDYLNRLRCEEAARLILTGNEKIYRIAEMTGFNNANHLIQVFTREMGMTPSKYRKDRAIPK